MIPTSPVTDPTLIEEFAERIDQLVEKIEMVEAEAERNRAELAEARAELEECRSETRDLSVRVVLMDSKLDTLDDRTRRAEAASGWRT